MKITTIGLDLAKIAKIDVFRSNFSQMFRMRLSAAASHPSGLPVAGGAFIAFRPLRRLLEYFSERVQLGHI